MAAGTLIVRTPRERPLFRSGRRHTLAPGDSVVGVFQGIIDSPPGTYILRVPHAAGGADVNGFVTVRARGAR